MNQITIGNLTVGGDAPCRVFGELSNSHNGSLDRALRIIDAIKEAGADAVKVQAYSVDDLIRLRGDGPAPDPWASQGFTMRTLYEKAQTPLEWMPALFDHARDIGIPIFSSVFGVDGFRVLNDVGNPCYKLAALDFGKGGLVDTARLTGKPIIASCGRDDCPMTLADIVLYAPEGYPQRAANLRHIRNGYDGYSYHGTNPSVPTMAVAAGAKAVEVHVQLDNEPSELEANVSLTMTQLAILVRGVRYAESML